MGVFLVLFAYASVATRWGSLMPGMLLYLAAVIIWLFWLSHLACTVLIGPIAVSGIGNRWLVIVGLVVASVIAGGFVSNIGRFVRVQEIQMAVEAGLQRDASQLLLHWPVKESRIFCGDPAYADLPQSIRMLNPVYVTNDRSDFPDSPANIGLCKNGFGGFARGVRVFQSDHDAESYKTDAEGWCERIATGVYYWWHPT